jgi:predicted PhzF superfamily epimerase YddE/YHI9
MAATSTPQSVQPYLQAPTLNFTTLDVFTTTPYAGNPLAIILLPLSTNLSKTQKQRIAHEFNLSESIFLHQSSSAKPQEWEVEIFTTEEELPFAGHPVIGASFYVLGRCSDQNADGLRKGVLITRAGPIAISQTQSGRVQADIPHDIHLHNRTLSHLPRSSLGLSSHSTISNAELRAPLVSIVKGMTFLLVKLPSLELLGELKLGGGKINFGGVLDSEDGWGESFVAKYYYVVLERTLDDEGKEVVRVRTRMIEQQLEDPATGSAACALSSYLALKASRSSKFEITQGVEMGRRSDIGVEVEVGGNDEGSPSVKTVKLIGNAVVVMEGGLRI